MPASSDRTRCSQAYWDTAAETYERDFTGTLIGQLWREAVRRELDRGFQAGQRVVELNCGGDAYLRLWRPRLRLAADAKTLARYELAGPADRVAG